MAKVTLIFEDIVDDGVEKVALSGAFEAEDKDTVTAAGAMGLAIKKLFSEGWLAQNCNAICPELFVPGEGLSNDSKETEETNGEDNDIDTK